MSYGDVQPVPRPGKQIPVEELSILLEVSSLLTASLDLPTVLQRAVDSAVKVLRLETGAIYLMDAGKLLLGATTPPLGAELQWLCLQPELPDDHPHLKKALDSRSAVFLPDTKTELLSAAEMAICEARHLRSVLYIPLVFEERSIGAIIVGTIRKPRGFSNHDVILCKTLSHQITLAIANAQLYRTVRFSHEELLKAYDATLQGWSLALELRDQETQGHTLRVTDLSVLLARKVGMSEDDIVHLRRGAMLHDIGKMSIPDNILHKPGPLTEAEWATMQLHPGYARQFLCQIDYLLPAIDIPYCHHEKWDGSGYPRGLKGTEIPLAARIFAVIDVFDALTSDRPYRRAWSRSDALSYLREQSGSHFDPQILSIFLDEIV